MKTFHSVFFVVAASLVVTVDSSDTIRNIIHKERRFLLYNSRLLTGECLPICNAPAPTEKPTGFPTENPTKVLTADPTRTPTGNPTGSPTLNPTREPTADPTQNPTNPPTVPPTKNPTNEPTASPTTDSPTASPTKDPTNQPTTEVPTWGADLVIPPPECDESLLNLGYGFSEAMHDPALGNSHYGQDGSCFPKVHNINASPSGKDDAVAVLVGGNYYGKNGAELEGNLVVMGNFLVDSSGPSNFVSAGEGSQITPHYGGNCITVGGDVSSAKRLEIYNPSYKCSFVCKGNCQDSNTIAPKWMTDMGFEYKQDTNLDMTKYERQIELLRKKSENWASLPDTSGSEWGVSNQNMNIECSAEDVVQIFNIDAASLSGNDYSSYVFNKHCSDKTILINVQGTGDITFTTRHMKWTNQNGQIQNGGWANFPSCMNSAILWNFPTAQNVLINGSDEMQGSLLVTGNLNFESIGQSGRTMVLGDLTQNRSGSEFHSFEFRPPKPLPEIDCGDLEVLELAEEDCSCNKGDDSKQSFKCGNEVYLCPGVDKVCSTTGSQNSLYYSIDQDQCNLMKSVEIGEKCIPLPQYNIISPKGLSNRVCYTDEYSGLHGMKEDGSCDVCKESFAPKLEPPIDEDDSGEEPKCTAKNNNNGVTDASCAKCDVNAQNVVKYWPCNLKPPKCQGACNLF